MLIRPGLGIGDVGEVSWPWALRRALLQFLVSDHNLAVETGRYCKPRRAREERLCVACAAAGVEAVDDEAHALDECPALAELREHFWSQVCRVHIGRSRRGDGVVRLLTGLGALERASRRQVWRSLATFVHGIAQIRSRTRHIDTQSAARREIYILTHNAQNEHYLFNMTLNACTSEKRSCKPRM